VEDIALLAGRHGIPVRHDGDGEDWVRDHRPDLLLAATYHRILRQPLIDSAKVAVNIHPSLLPAYRGPNPFFWVLANGETETGITAHRLVAQADAGDILWQDRIAIAADETQGSLRRRLCEPMGPAAVAMARAARTGDWHAVVQDEAAATSFPRPDDDSRVIPTALPVADIARRVRAWAPFPGAVIAGHHVCGLARNALVPAVPLRPGETRLAAPDLLAVAGLDGTIMLTLAS